MKLVGYQCARYNVHNKAIKHRRPQCGRLDLKIWRFFRPLMAGVKSMGHLMNLNFSGTYTRAGGETKVFSFSREVDEKVGEGFLTDREPGDGYPPYDEVKDFVVGYLIENKELPEYFHAGVYSFANALAAEGLASLNF